MLTIRSKKMSSLLVVGVCGDSEWFPPHVKRRMIQKQSAGVKRSVISYEDAKEWYNFYEGKVAGIFDLTVPQKIVESSRLAVFAPIGLEVLLDNYRQYFPGKVADYCNENVARDIVDVAYRNGGQTFTCWVVDDIRQIQETEFSGTDLATKGFSGITLAERLIFGLQYYQKTGQHMDDGESNLCTGSLSTSINRHPVVRFDNGWIQILCPNFNLPRY